MLQENRRRIVAHLTILQTILNRRLVTVLVRMIVFINCYQLTIRMACKHLQWVMLVGHCGKQFTLLSWQIGECIQPHFCTNCHISQLLNCVKQQVVFVVVKHMKQHSLTDLVRETGYLHICRVCRELHFLTFLAEFENCARKWKVFIMEQTVQVYIFVT